MNGLILAGGNSTRMGCDKALIEYHGLPQYKFLYNLLSPICEYTFVSSNDKLDLPNIPDDPAYSDIGPMAGLLSAFDRANSDWLVIAVDYPLISTNELQLLASSESELATVMFNPTTNFYEPTIGLYRKKFGFTLMDNFKNNQFSLQKILQENNIKKAIPQNLETIQSINSFEEMMSMKIKLRSC